jgi:hypothetical protein
MAMSHSPACDRLDLVAVAAVGLAREVGLQALGPGGGGGFVVVGDDGAEEGDVVVMVPERSRCGLSIFGGEVFVGGHFAGGHAVLGGIDDAGAEVRPNHWSFGSRRASGMLASRTSDCTGWRTPASTICRRRAMSTVRTRSAGERSPFGLQAFGHALVDEGHVDGDAGFGGEGIDEGLDQLGLAVGVDVDFLGEDRGGAGEKGEGGETQHC